MDALDWIGRRFRGGQLCFIAPGGRQWTLGVGEPRAEVRVRDEAVFGRLLRHPALAFGETYMDGDWEPADGDLRQVLAVATRILGATPPTQLLQQLRLAMAKLVEHNDALLATRNVAHHYDLDHTLYASFLDRDLHYSCAYYRSPDMSLEAAQQAKCALVAAKLDLQPGMRVLDIGSGWGSLAMYLSQHHGVHVTGITLSREQLAVARERAHARGLDDRVEFRLEDYRDTRGQFDAVVSVGMFEHVGRPHYPAYFSAIERLLNEQGVALVHCIGRSSGPGTTNPWIRKYIFPGGYCPAASEVLAAIEPTRLMLTDLEVLRLHYARTLEEWHRRFQQARASARERHGERFWGSSG